MDCLVTKLKGIVNNDTLLPLNGMFIKVVSNYDQNLSNSQRYLFLLSKNDIQVSVVGGDNNFTTNSDLTTGEKNTITVNSVSGTGAYLKKGNYTLLVSDKYSLTSIGELTNEVNGLSFNINDLKFNDGFPNIYANIVYNDIEGDLSILAGKTIQNFKAGSKITGNIEVINDINWENNYCVFNVFSRERLITGNIANLSVNNKIAVFGINSQTKVTGSLSTISDKFPNLSQLIVQNSNITGDIGDITSPIIFMGVYNCPGISGTIEDFVATQRSHGRNTGTCDNGGAWDNNVTLNGNPINNGSNSFTWTASQITCGDITVNA